MLLLFALSLEKHMLLFEEAGKYQLSLQHSKENSPSCHISEPVLHTLKLRFEYSLLGILPSR